MMVFWGLLALCAFASSAPAQNPIAMPVPAVEEEELPVLGNAPVVIELFSSQACVFCPKADRLFADLLKQDNVIGLACHVDYFDVKTGSLAQPFCTERQTWYMEKLFAGPNYTPQMVINGAVDVVGYKFNDVVSALRRATFSQVLPLGITETSAAGTYKVTLPPQRPEPLQDYKLWLALYDEPHELTIAEGRNQGQRATYYNIVSQLGSSDKLGGDIYVTPPMKNQHRGFVVILQNMKTGKIFAVGRHKKTK